MKIEIEVTEDELRDALARHIRTAVADRVNQWSAKQEVRAAVNQAWTETMQAMVREQLANSEVLRQQVQDAIRAKLQGQITRLMKEGK